MSWLLIGFCAPLLWAISTHIDKYLVERFFKESDVAVLLVFTGLIGFVPLPAIWWFYPSALSMPTGAIAAIVLSGAVYMGAMLFYLGALQTEEASVIAPMFQVGTLFAMVLAYLILGEVLTVRQIAGGVLIMGAMAAVSFQGATRLKLRPVLLMTACGLALAATSVIFKLFAIRDEFWPVTFWTFFGNALFGTGLLLVPSYRLQFISLFRTNPGAIIAINLSNELINLGGSLAARYAMILGPLGLVQAIVSTSPLFVFATGVALTVFMPRLGREDLSPRNLFLKGAAAIAVVAGVVLIRGQHGTF